MIKNIILAAVLAEKSAALKEHGLFNSRMEGLAVIDEEHAEFQSEIRWGARDGQTREAVQLVAMGLRWLEQFGDIDTMVEEYDLQKLDLQKLGEYILSHRAEAKEGARVNGVGSNAASGPKPDPANQGPANQGPANQAQTAAGVGAFAAGINAEQLALRIELEKKLGAMPGVLPIEVLMRYDKWVTGLAGLCGK